MGLAAGLIFPGMAWVIFALILKNRFGTGDKLVDSTIII